MLVIIYGSLATLYVGCVQKVTYLSRGQRISAIAAMDCTGIIELKLIKGTVDSHIFDFIRGDLLPQLQPLDGTNPPSVVILDNCSIHHVESIHELYI